MFKWYVPRQNKKKKKKKSIQSKYEYSEHPVQQILLGVMLPFYTIDTVK